MKVLTFLTEGFETVEALAVIDILRRADIKVVTVSITGNKIVESAQNIKVQTDADISDISYDKDDVLFLPGGPGHKSYYQCEKLMDMLTKHNDNGGRIAAICAAPSVLGKLGLLNGKKATCFPGFEELLTGAEVASSDIRVVTDGNITTSRGMGTSIDLGLELVKLIAGSTRADELARSTQYVVG